MALVGAAAAAAIWVTRPAPELGVPVDWQAIYWERIATGDCEDAPFILSQLAAQDPAPLTDERWQTELDRLEACANPDWANVLEFLRDLSDVVEPQTNADLVLMAWEDWFDPQSPLGRTEYLGARARATLLTASCYLPYTHLHVRWSFRAGRFAALKSGGEIRRVLAGSLGDAALLDPAYERDRLRCAERFYRAGGHHAEAADRAGSFWIAEKYLSLADDMGHPLAPLARAKLDLDHPLLAYPSTRIGDERCPARDALGWDHAVPIAFDRYLFPFLVRRPDKQFMYTCATTIFLSGQRQLR